MKSIHMQTEENMEMSKVSRWVDEWMGGWVDGWMGINYFVAFSLQRGSKRCVFVVQTTTKIQETNMFSATGADTIYHKTIDQGVIYVLKYEKGNEKYHTQVDKSIKTLDDHLKMHTSSETTFFRSINDDDTTSSKVVSIERGARKENYLYRTIFDSRDNVLPGVTVLKNQQSTSAGGTQARRGRRTVQENTGKFI